MTKLTVGRVSNYSVTDDLGEKNSGITLEGEALEIKEENIGATLINVDIETLFLTAMKIKEVCYLNEIKSKLFLNRSV